jgi:hypothetical protein
MISKMIGIVAELEIADLLEAGEKSAEDLAEITSTDASALYRGLRMLAATGILQESSESKFSLAPGARILVSTAPGSMRAMMIYWTQVWHDVAHSHILHSIKTGEPAFARVHGKPFFEWLQENPDKIQVFNKAMSDFSMAKGAAVAAAYPFTKYKYIVDVGGGHGALLAAVLHRAPESRGILFDVPEVRQGAYTLLSKNGLLDRVDVIPGNFLSPDQIPNGYNLYILKHIVHALGDNKCVSILSHISNSLAPNGRVLILEYLVSNVHRGAIFDIDMLVMTKGGKERTADEFKVLLESAGLRLLRIIPTRSPLVIIEAEKRPPALTQYFVSWKS